MERELKAASNWLVSGGGVGGIAGLSPFYAPSCKYRLRLRAMAAEHTFESNESTSLNKKLSSFLAFPFKFLDGESVM